MLILAVLTMLALLVTLAHTDQVARTETRSGMPLTTIEQVTETKIKRADVPTGLINCYTFRLDEPIAHDTSLAFYTTHQYAAVYLDGELVCSLQPAGEHRITKTLGSNWVMIPLYAEDSGKADEPDDQPGEEPSKGDITKEEVQNTKLLARSQVSSLHGYYAVRVKWFRTDGRLKPEDFDGFEIQRSQQRSSGYQTIYRTDGKLWYKNNAHLQLGKKYYYRVRCYKIIDGEKVYTKWSWKAWRTVKAKDVKAKGGLLVLKDK